jgi:hypothetical protein
MLRGRTRYRDRSRDNSALTYILLSFVGAGRSAGAQISDSGAGGALAPQPVLAFETKRSS